MSALQSNKTITAAMLAIGDEILSGRTKDKNIVFLADELTKSGIDLKEVRIVGDDERAIIDAINALRKKYDYIFTSGGIGPTHDDITAQSVAMAFNLPCIYNKEAEKVLVEYYKSRDLPFTAARRLMTRTPEGASLIDNPISAAPGFHIENVFVMAGVPEVFAVMVRNCLTLLPKGQAIMSRSITCPFGEGVISEPLAQIQRMFPQTTIGSYPHFCMDNQLGKNDHVTFTVELVVRSRNIQALDDAVVAIETMLSHMETKVQPTIA